MTTLACDEFRDSAPDLALGLLAGNERGAAISHLVTCASCRRHLEGLVQVADTLLLLAPSVEPEIGFESRVMARLAADGAFSPHLTRARSDAVPPQVSPLSPTATSAARARRRWARSATIGIAAALMLLAGLTGLVTGVTRGRDAGRTSALKQGQAARTVVLRADAGRSTCQLVVFPSVGTQPAQLVVQLDEPGDAPGVYQVLAEPTAGSPAVLVGTINMVDGHGMLTASIPAGTGPVHAVRITEGSHSVKYRATFQSV
ncbi:MAG: hypothetical protein M3083_17505 [Actinomycetota bacterium]|nr:hypothetical protein [Actinomycetota bacterium]